jgi:hypothetical protein
MRFFVMGESVEDDYPERLVDAVLRTLKAGPGSGTEKQ